MTIEEEVFQKQRPNFAKLLTFGFCKENDHYVWQKPFFDHQFMAHLIITDKGKVTGKVIDLNSNEPYLPLRASHLGPYASQVKEAYQDLLKTIADQCFTRMPFHSPQANRIANAIAQHFHDHPEFVFKRLPDDAVFREPISQKWYGLVMNIPRQKLTTQSASANDRIEILEFRINPDHRANLLEQAGVYPAYHMNKDNWLCVVLDDTQSDQQILTWVDQSRQFLCQPHTWLIPANPRYYDIMHAFKDPDELLLWKQSTKVRVGDTVFIYVTNPVKAVIFKCRAAQVNIPYHYRSKQVNLKQAMKLQFIQRYSPSQYSFDFLKAHGIRYIRGPRKLSAQLIKLLH
jgi:predicted DNA-binding protein (MmcQ/YjbR family)/predicted transcriptional regulator